MSHQPHIKHTNKTGIKESENFFDYRRLEIMYQKNYALKINPQVEEVQIKLSHIDTSGNYSLQSKVLDGLSMC